MARGGRGGILGEETVLKSERYSIGSVERSMSGPWLGVSEARNGVYDDIFVFIRHFQGCKKLV